MAATSPRSQSSRLLTLVYTFEGGMTAVIWTDVVQLAFCLGGALLAVFALLHSSPGRMGDHSLRGRRRGQVSHLRYFVEPLLHLHVMVRRDRRRVLHHCESRHRSADCAAPALGSQRDSGQVGAGGQRLCRLVSVHSLPVDWRHAVRVLFKISTAGRIHSLRRDLPQHSSRHRCRMA